MKRIVNTLLQLIDFFPSEGFLVFATNSIKIIDEALLRRLDRVIEIPLPNPS
jgi:SpoVK/Ycf46/Vps4 family AAA+-type ATPase